MKIFINDIPVYILSEKKINMNRVYGIIIREFEDIVPTKLSDDVLIMDASFTQIDSLLKIMTDKKLKKVHSIFFSSKKKRELIDYLKNKFKVIEAGGGVVKKGNEILLIYRRKIWDLPKGKLDNGETLETCALREVEEETGIEVKIDKKIGFIWHTYVTKKKYILKKTHWYAMDCVSDKKMTPQKEEGIEKVKWMKIEEVRKVLHESYHSIRYVIQEYIKIVNKI